MNTYNPNAHMPNCDEDGNGCTCSWRILKLQLFLARQLPGEIHINPEDSIAARFVWRKTSRGPVDETSWDYIVRRVEEKLTADQAYIYRANLWNVTKSHAPHEYDGVNGEAHNRRYCNAPWPTRAIALSQTLNIPIE